MGVWSVGDERTPFVEGAGGYGGDDGAGLADYWEHEPREREKVHLRSTAQGHQQHLEEFVGF